MASRADANQAVAKDDMQLENINGGKLAHATLVRT
jgi:hypothetical protein